MNIKRILWVLLTLVITLALMVACKTSDGPSGDEGMKEPYTIDFIVNGVSEYTVVYDDSNEVITKQVKNFVKKMDNNFFVTLQAVGISEADADYGKEIVVGAVREAGRGATAKLKGADFSVTIVDDDIVLSSSSDRLYPYLFEVFAEEYLPAFDQGNLTISSDHNVLWSTSKYRDTTYFERLSKMGVTSELIEKIFEYRTFTAEDGTTLPYRMYVPYEYDENKEYPVLILLHGAGERGTDNRANLEHMVRDMFDHPDTPMAEAIVICPQCPQAPNQWVDTPWAHGNYSVDALKMSNELNAVLELLWAIEDKFSTDDDRYYITGLSMGGFGTWDMIMRNPDLFAAAVPICGGADPHYADAICDMPIYTVHGSADPTVPVAGTRAMVEALKAAGSPVIYQELEGEGHGVWNWAAQNTDLWEWLFSQSK
jgi:predicted esterase